MLHNYILKGRWVLNTYLKMDINNAIIKNTIRMEIYTFLIAHIQKALPLILIINIWRNQNEI